LFSRLKKGLLYSFIGYSFFGFLIFPWVLKPQLTSLIQTQTYAHLSIDEISFNPFIFRLQLHKLKLSDDNNKTLLSFKNLSVNLDPSSLFYGAVHIKNVSLQEPKVYVTYNKDKSLNLLKILKESQSKAQEESTPPRIIIDKIMLLDGGVHYLDYTREKIFSFSFNNIGFSLEDIDTKHSKSSDAKIRFFSSLGDGGFIDFKTDIISLKPLVINGSVDFEASKLYSSWKYIREILNLEVADGKVSFSGQYALNLDDLNASTISNVNLAVEKLRVIPKDMHKDILTLKDFHISNTTLKPFTHEAEIQEISLDALYVSAVREENKSLDWEAYLKVNSQESSESQEDNTSTTASPQWHITLDKIAFKNIAFMFEDRAVKPNVISKIEKLSLTAENITLSGVEPFSYELEFLLNGSQCTSHGLILHKNLHINAQTSCKDFNIVHYNPYIDEVMKRELKTYNVSLKSAFLDFSLNSEVDKIASDIFLTLKESRVSLKDVSFHKRTTNEPIVKLKSFTFDGIALNTQSKELFFKDIELNKLLLNPRRYKNGKLNVSDLIATKKNKKVKREKDESTFHVQAEKIFLKNAKISFLDEALEHKTNNLIDAINLNVYNIDSQKRSWLSYKSSMRVNKKGYIKTKGKLRHTPLKQKGTFRINKLSLKELNPYLQENSFLQIEDGQVSLNGKTAYGVSSVRPDLRVQSSFALNSFFLHDMRDNSLLLSLNEVKTNAFTFEFAPNRFYINELDINSFYVNAVIDANKSMNFSKLMRMNNQTQTKEEETKTPFPMSIARINVALGSAKFADYSIPIRFNTHIHNLDGVIYAISNQAGETTYVNIAGEVDKYGSTRLKGSIDISNPKAYIDLDFNFKNLELNSLSGYSASFAGYKIDSGKLYLDLGYDILNSKLYGSNSIIMKEVVLGDAIEDENVTTLPLGFVLGLLEDSDGVVDIDMPVEGNVDEPDFKYGTLVLKTIGGLITKAVTSPFKFLASSMGIDGEELSFIEFDPGTTVISPPQREKLDQVSKMMRKKPKIALEITAVYNLNSDTQAIRLEKLISLVMHKSGLKNRKDHENAMSTELLENIYKEQGDEKKLQELQEKLANKYKDEEYERIYHLEVLKLAISIQTVSKSELEALATHRTQAISEYLINEKNIDKSRILKTKEILSNETEEKLVQIDLQIEVK